MKKKMIAILCFLFTIVLTSCHTTNNSSISYSYTDPSYIEQSESVTPQQIEVLFTALKNFFPYVRLCRDQLYRCDLLFFGRLRQPVAHICCRTGLPLYASPWLPGTQSGHSRLHRFTDRTQEPRHVHNSQE